MVLLKNQNFYAQSPTTMKKFINSEKNHLKCSSGLVDRSFDIPAEISSTKVQTCFTQTPELFLKIYFLPNLFTTKYFFGHVECSFDKPATFFLMKNLQFLTLKPDCF